MHSTLLPAAYTLLTVLLMGATSFVVSRARGRYGIQAPATTGHPAFERAFRVQMNTLEAAAMYLPALWVDALYGSSWALAAGGLLWFAGRLWYAWGYLEEPRKRSSGFGIAALGLLLTLGDAAFGVARSALA